MRATVMLLCFFVVSWAGGQPVDPLATADPLDLARGARRLGDDAVLGRLEGGSTNRRLGAIRATPWLAEPVAAIEALAVMAGGDDPRLAPAACLSLWRIARGLGDGTLEVGEGGSHVLVSALEATASVARDESLRSDLRVLLGDAEGHLRETLGQRVPPSSEP